MVFRTTWSLTSGTGEMTQQGASPLTSLTRPRLRLVSPGDPPPVLVPPVPTSGAKTPLCTMNCTTLSVRHFVCVIVATLLALIKNYMLKSQSGVTFLMINGEARIAREARIVR